jgi:hypothetical protein
MLQVFDTGEQVPITLPGDTDNPTIFYGIPTTRRGLARWRALEAYAEKRTKTVAADDTPDAALAIADASVEEELNFLASSIAKIENAWPDGATLTKVDEIRGFLSRLPFVQHVHIRDALMDGTRLRELTFRGNAAAGDPGPA